MPNSCEFSYVGVKLQKAPAWAGAEVGVACASGWCVLLDRQPILNSREHIVRRVTTVVS